jgi:hypothetical protein
MPSDHDAAVGKRPRDRAADSPMTRELAIPIPNPALKRERQFVVIAASLTSTRF